MLFKPRHIPLIREGTKTATRRDWADGYAKPNVGTVQMASTEMFQSDDECDCYIRILDVYEEPLGEMDQEDAEKEGGYELADFREAWRDINGDYDPEQVVSVVEFEYVGRERPGDQPKAVTDGGTQERPERRTRELPSGDTVIEAGDCQFVASPSGTVHKRGEYDGDEYDYQYHPLCGQRLPPSSMWRTVEADSEEEAVLKYNRRPCSKCFDGHYRLEKWRKKKHSATVMDHVDLPERWSE